MTKRYARPESSFQMTREDFTQWVIMSPLDTLMHVALSYEQLAAQPDVLPPRAMLWRGMAAKLRAEHAALINIVLGSAG